MIDAYDVAFNVVTHVIIGDRLMDVKTCETDGNALGLNDIIMISSVDGMVDCFELGHSEE